MQPTLPAALYRDPAVFQRERQGVFAAGWQFLGHEREAAGEGDYLAGDVAGWPVLAVRGKDGVLRGFHNVCRHRAGPLVGAGAGNCGGELTCRYHGWRYALDGRLRAATGFGAVDGFDSREFGLLGLRLEIWRGLVFATMDAGAAPLADHVAPLEALLAGRGLDIAAPALRRSHDLACDWKTYAENYLEGYHIGSVHPLLSEELGGADYRVRVEGDLVVQEAVGVAGAEIHTQIHPAMFEAMFESAPLTKRRIAEQKMIATSMNVGPGRKQVTRPCQTQFLGGGRCTF